MCTEISKGAFILCHTRATEENVQCKVYLEGNINTNTESGLKEGQWLRKKKYQTGT